MAYRQLFNKFYIAKLASGDLREVDVLEKMKDVLSEISKNSLVPTRSWNPSRKTRKPAAVMSNTNCILIVIDRQVSRMLAFSNEPASEESNSDMSDDLIYDDDDDGGRQRQNAHFCSFLRGWTPKSSIVFHPSYNNDVVSCTPHGTLRHGDCIWHDSRFVQISVSLSFFFFHKRHGVLNIHAQVNPPETCSLWDS